jgi:hypothetical protein
MDAHDYARLASLVAAERVALHAALARFQTHDIGHDWRGPSRHQAEVSHQAATEACHASLSALDDAEDEARRLWREALACTNPLGV